MPRLPTLTTTDEIDIALGTLLILRRQKVIETKAEYDRMKKRLVLRRKEIVEERERLARLAKAEAERRKKEEEVKARRRLRQREARAVKITKIGTTQLFASRQILNQTYQNVSLIHNRVEEYTGRKAKFLTDFEGNRLPVPIYEYWYSVRPESPEDNIDNADFISKVVKQVRPLQDLKMIKIYYITIEINEQGNPIARYFQRIVKVSNRSLIADQLSEDLGTTWKKTNPSVSSLFINGLDYIMIPVPAGACDGREHHHAIGDLKVCSPKSKGNNCIFACMNHASKSTFKNDHTRKLLGFSEGTPISVDQLEAVAKFYKRTIRLCNEYGERVMDYNVGFDVVSIVLYFGHYVLMEGEYKWCQKCQVQYLKSHTCNKKTVLWVAKNKKGENVVVPRKIHQTEAFDKKDIIFYDIETFKNGDELSITPYAVSWWVDGELHTQYGEGCFDRFLDIVLTYENKYITAYNGAGFDFHFLAKTLLARGLKITDLIMNGGSILTMKFGNNLKMWDICRFTLSSLADACKAFGVRDDQAKTSFDHHKIKSWSDVLKYESEVRPYVQQDVIAMMAVFDGLNEMFFEMFDVHIVKFLTLSALSYSIWTTMFDAEYLEIPDGRKYDFIRESLFGGRTYPMRREYTSKHYSDLMAVKDDKVALKEMYSKLEDYVFVADVSSLYPASMKQYKYPTGKGKWDMNPTSISKIGIYEVDLEVPKSLIVPILPRREKGRVIWDLTDRKGIYTSADLENALRFGYKITKFYRAITYDTSSDIFSAYIDKCYKLKEDNDEGKEGASPVKRQIGKILMNALYGKTLERARFTETRLCNNSLDCWKFQKEYNVEQFVPMGDKVLMVGSAYENKRDESINKASQLGTFILSYSRRIMIDAMSAICPKMDSHFFYYTDTDSLHIPSSALPGLKEKGWLEPVIGKLSDDCKGGRVIRELNLAPKLYMYLCLMPDGKFKTSLKAKGIPKQFLSPELFENQQSKEISMPSRLKKVGYGLHTQVAHRSESAFSILSIDMKRTFLKNEWAGMDFDGTYWYPKGYIKSRE